MSRHSSRAGTALVHLPETDPALAALALWCDHRDGTAPTCTRGDVVFYGPEFPALSLPEQIGLSGHHVLHVALRHASRMAAMAARQGGGFAAELYALAADALVNEAILQAGHALPRPAIRLTDLLVRALGVQAANSDALAEWDLDRLYLTLLRDGAQGARDYAAAQGFEPDLAAGDTDPEHDTKAPDWRGRLTRALAAGQQAGHGLGLLAGRIGDLPVQRTPWELVLRGLLARALSDTPRRSHARPARRWLAMEAQARATTSPSPGFEPGQLRLSHKPRIVVGLDSSGSVPDDLLAQFGSELAAIAQRTGAETHLLAFDETVHAARQIGSGDWGDSLSYQAVRRGGGTAFEDLMTQAALRDPAIVVVLTDLDGRFGADRPSFPVIWAVPEAPATAPPFGRVLVMAG